MFTSLFVVQMCLSSCMSCAFTLASHNYNGASCPQTCFFFSSFFSTDFCDQPNVAEFNDTPMTEYCDSVLNMKRFLKEINDTVFNDVSDLKRQRLARFREVPHMRVLARHRTRRSAQVSLVHAPRRVTARAW